MPLIFEESSPGRRGVDAKGGAASEERAIAILGDELCRGEIEGFPELSEPQVLRHFLRLSQLNFGQALQFYPLGSCTMKYNPVLNDEMAAMPGFAGLHPITPAAAGAGRDRIDGAAGSGAGGNHAGWTRCRCIPPPARKGNWRDC